MRLRLRARLRKAYPGIHDLGLLGYVGLPAVMVLGLFMVAASVIGVGERIGLAYGERLHPDIKPCPQIVPEC